MLEEEIKKIVKEVVKDNTSLKVQQRLDVIKALRNLAVTLEMELEVDIESRKPKAIAPKVAQTIEPVKEPEEVEEEETEDEQPETLEWVKEQDGVLEKGETQVWRYGNHTLTVWMEDKKHYAQIDDGKSEELWTQRALEKIQKRIEKMEQ